MTAIVELRNGKSAPEPAVKTTMINLQLVAGRDWLAFYELVSVCRDPDHSIFGDCGATLERLALLDAGGRPHEIVRDVVLSAVTGEDFGLRIGSPIAGESEEVQS
jgi:hypothetical protein